MELIWMSESGDEYSAMICSLKITLKPVGDKVEVLDTKDGQWFRRSRGTVAGPMTNAMRVVQNRYIV